MTSTTATTHDRDQTIRTLVDAAPLLSDVQQRRLRALLTPVTRRRSGGAA